MITVTSKTDKYLMELTNGVVTLNADVPADHGGSGQHIAPFELLRASFAACLCATCRMLMDKRNLAYDSVVVKVDVDKDSTPGKTIFKYGITINADNITEADKAKFAKMAYNGCPIHKALEQEIVFEAL